MNSRWPRPVLLSLSLLVSACASGDANDAAVLSSTVDRTTVVDGLDSSATGRDLDAEIPEGGSEQVENADEAGAATGSSALPTTTGRAGPSEPVETDAADENAEPDDSPTSAEDDRANDSLLPSETTIATTAAPSTVVTTTSSPPVSLETTQRTTSSTGLTSTSRPVPTTVRSTTTERNVPATTASPTTTTSARPVPTTTTIRPAPVDTARFPRSPVVRSGAQMLVDSGFAGLDGKRVGIIVNHVSKVGNTHLIDVFDRASEVELVAIFGPEHGVRGTADAGEKVSDDLDEKTGTPILSLYGNSRKPTPEMLEGIDVLVFDLQDVGTRFYTYISTMGLAMQAAAAADIEFVVLDRPNPLGGLDTEGFTRLAAQDSFIGQYPIPASYALTSGELANAIKGERWMSGLGDLDLRVVELDGWNRRMQWPDTGMTWVGPSPGLPTFESALAYPGTVLLEATTVSYGTGTYHPFSTAGAPWIDKTELANDLNGRGLPGVWFLPVSYTPRVIEGLSVRPRLEGELVHGVRYVFTDYRTVDPVRTGVHLLDAIRRQAEANDIDNWLDRPKTFDLLSGNPTLRRMLLAGDDPEKIAATWSADNTRFAGVHSRYRLYR